MIKSSAEAIGAGATLASVVVVQETTILGIGSALLLACFAGSLFGLAHTDPESWGKLLKLPRGSKAKRAGWFFLRAVGLLFTVCAIAIFMGWLVTSIPHVPVPEWVKAVPAVSLGGLLSYGGQRWVPKLLAVVDWLIDRRTPK